MIRKTKNIIKKKKRRRIDIYIYISMNNYIQHTNSAILQNNQIIQNNFCKYTYIRNKKKKKEKRDL